MTYFFFYEFRYKLALGIVLILIFISIFFFLIPEIRLYKQKKADLNEFQLISSRIKLWKNYRSLKEEKETKSKYVKGLESKLYFVDEIYLLVESIQSIFQSTGIEPISFNLGSIIEDKIYFYQNMQIKIQGSYEEILSFLSLIVKKHLIKNLDFEIGPYQDSLLQCSLNLEVYLKPGKWSD
ncbi:hypothetical protein BBF96_09280 [Anoxybacter fermentans]|uniref:Pilus assembly protein PilO n=1 Tax=Anoxybacter fermentans TaxID=1323375 RepID=A0A3Q9HRA7_9FIRM|nr:type 4a pilus biogenesis protein PilO [Anoxybacter fermentans]AZR73563.1 hypothetical protein BBF96_09280 [Anoxybacter fermentans]